MKNKQDNFREFLLYTTPNGKVEVEIFLKDENIWLNQIRIAELFGVDRSVVLKHLQNIFKEGELDKKSTSAKIAQVQKEGSRSISRDVEFYNLDAIISVGYRVNSSQATHFRIWATERLREYIIKGFTMDDERLRNPEHFFGKIILKNNWQGFVIFVLVSAGYIRKLPTYMLSVVLITPQLVILPSNFLLLCRTSFILPSLEKLLRK